MPVPPKPDPKKYCGNCGERMRRKRYNGRLEDLGVFKRRKFCDQTCMAEAHEKRPVTKGGYLWRARRHRKEACERCGAAEDLHVHHRDGNWRNNNLTNLETLCSSCHLEHHWATDQRRHQARTTRRVPLEGLQELEGFADEIGPRLAEADAVWLRRIVVLLRDISA